MSEVVKEPEIDDHVESDIELDIEDDPIDIADEEPQEDYDSEDYDSDKEDYEYEDQQEEDFPEAETTEIMVNDEDRTTSDVLSKYEIIELISIRATQISKGNRVFTDITGLRDPISMAKKEIYDNQCPLLVKRHIGNNMYEVWNPNEMSKPKI